MMLAIFEEDIRFFQQINLYYPRTHSRALNNLTSRDALETTEIQKGPEKTPLKKPQKAPPGLLGSFTYV